VDEDGLPCAGWLVVDNLHFGQLGLNGFHSTTGCFEVGTGKDGRFHMEGVIPGLKPACSASESTTTPFSSVVSELTLKAGEVKDPCDLKAKALP
jgi:hypothetical protein